MGFISSFPARPAYCASERAAQISMKAAAARYGPQGVRVNIGGRKSWCGLVERHRLARLIHDRVELGWQR